MQKRFTVNEDDLKALRAIALRLKLNAARAQQRGEVVSVLTLDGMREIAARLLAISAPLDTTAA
jgi:hypothetical protein